MPNYYDFDKIFIKFALRKVRFMKIVFVLPEMRGGGSERVVAALSEEFLNRGYEVAILIFAGDQVVYDLDPRVEIVRAGVESKGNPILRLKRVKNMRAFYKANKDCYIFSFCVMGTVFSVLATFGMARKMLVSERNDPTRIEHPHIRNWSYRHADRLVFQTYDMSKCFPKAISKKGVVIPNPISTDIPEAYEGERDYRIVNVARLQKQKNHVLLIEAFSKFIDMLESDTDVNEIPYSLHIYGEGELRKELEAQIKALSLEDKVVLHGFTNNARDEIKNAGMFVLSSDYEGISNSMIEALAMGVPTISTDCPVGGSKMYIEDGKSGLLTKVGDADELAEAMYKLATNPEMAKSFSKESVKIRDKYSLEKIADEFLKAAGLPINCN